MFLARYANIQPSEFYRMREHEAQAWVNATNDRLEAERTQMGRDGFLRGDFDARTRP